MKTPQPNYDPFDNTPTPVPVDIVTGTLKARDWQTLYALVIEDIELLDAKHCRHTAKEMRKLQEALLAIMIPHGVRP